MIHENSEMGLIIRMKAGGIFVIIPYVVRPFETPDPLSIVLFLFFDIFLAKILDCPVDGPSLSVSGTLPYSIVSIAVRTDGPTVPCCAQYLYSHRYDINSTL